LNRKKWLAIVLAVAMIILSAALEHCVFSPQSTLRVFSQYDCIHPALLKSFSEETGIQVEYTVVHRETVTDDVDLYAQCDLLLADTELLSLLKDQGFLFPLSEDIIDPGADEHFQSVSFIQLDGCACPALWTTMGLIYDPSTTEVRLTGWSDLFSGEFTGRVVMPQTSREAYAVALSALGHSVNTQDESELASALEYLQQQRPQVLEYRSTADLEETFQLYPDAVACCYASDAIALMSNIPGLSFVMASEGSWQMLLSYAVPAGAEDETLSQALIDHLTTPLAMAKNAAYSGMAPVSREAYDLLDHSWKANPLAYPHGEDWEADPLLDSQPSSIQGERRVQWLLLRQEWVSTYR